MVYKCNGPRFESLKNPYTGEIIDSSMSASATGVTRFFAPTTYSPSDYFPTAKEAYRHWNRVNGIEGLKDGQPIVCAYTGRMLTLVEDEGLGWHYIGGHNIHMMYDRDTYLHFATMRNGVSPHKIPDTSTVGERVTKPVEHVKLTKGRRKHLEEQRTDLTEDGIRTAEHTMKELHGKFGLETSSTVSMAATKGA